MRLRRLPPVQFDLARFWRQDFVRRRAEPKFMAALATLSKRAIQIAERAHRETAAADPVFAREILDLEIYAARVRVKDLTWLRQKFTGRDLHPLALVIANHVYPDLRFEVLFCDDGAVVTDVERSVVFDFENFDRSSGGASLIYVEDENFTGTAAQQAEADRLIDAQIARDLN